MQILKFPAWIYSQFIQDIMIKRKKMFKKFHRNVQITFLEKNVSNRENATKTVLLSVFFNHIYLNTCKRFLTADKLLVMR